MQCFKNASVLSNFIPTCNFFNNIFISEQLNLNFESQQPDSQASETLLTVR